MSDIINQFESLPLHVRLKEWYAWLGPVKFSLITIDAARNNETLEDHLLQTYGKECILDNYVIEQNVDLDYDRYHDRQLEDC